MRLRFELSPSFAFAELWRTSRQSPSSCRMIMASGSSWADGHGDFAGIIGPPDGPECRAFPFFRPLPEHHLVHIDLAVVRRPERKYHAAQDPVGQKQPNVWGLYDMHGNVWELCRDWDCSYPGGSVTDPAGPAAGSYHASRGGCFAVGAACCRSAGRGWDLPDSRISNIGFRVALAPSL